MRQKNPRNNQTFDLMGTLAGPHEEKNAAKKKKQAKNKNKKQPKCYILAIEVKVMVRFRSSI